MGGGLMQLATKGAEDVFLTGDPQITFFKAVYNQHTSFSREISQLVPDKPFLNGSKSKIVISRNGDLVGNMFIHFTTTQYDKTNRTWGSYINYIDLKIGEHLIDRQYGEWLDIWHDLTVSNDKVGGYQPNLTTSSNAKSAGTIEMMGNNLGSFNTGDPASVLIPLQFWFNKTTGFALPLIALSFAEVSIEINFKQADTDLNNNTLGGGVTQDEYLIVDYFHLDDYERKIFNEKRIEYLIEQVQFDEDPELISKNGESYITAPFKFNHPVKEIIWTIQKADKDYITNINSAYFQLNGVNLNDPLPSMYFTHVEPYKFHTRIPKKGHLFVQSFALRPEEHEPSGSCNFSRIDKSNLKIKPKTAGEIDKINIYATNYNILSIQNGRAGLPYGY